MSDALREGQTPAQRLDRLLIAALKSNPKPSDSVSQGDKKKYSEGMSARLAAAFADELRTRGMKDALPAGPGEVRPSGAARRFAGGVSATKLDVSWATPESGLLLGISIACINWKDARADSYQKNLTNRRGDMINQALTLHRRFPFAVLGGILVLDKNAGEDNVLVAADGTSRPRKRESTSTNALALMRSCSARADVHGSDERFEKLYVALVDANRFSPKLVCYDVDSPPEPVEVAKGLDHLVALVAERNVDFYRAADGMIRKAAPNG